MLELNQAKTLSSAPRSLSYDLPSFLANEGDCYISIDAKSHADTAVPIKNSIEQLMMGVKARTEHLNRRLGKVNGSAFVGETAKAYSEFAVDDLKAQQWFYRATLMACYDNCITAWSTNIWDNISGSEIEPTRDNFEALVNLAYPDGGISDVPDLLNVFERMRTELLDTSGDEAEAVAEVQRQDEKN